MVEKADNNRDKAFVLVLYESGCRIGELLSLKIRNIQPTEHGIALTVKGKTGQRRVLIISSAPALASWLNLHPYRNNPDSLVWLGIGNRNKNDSLRYPAVCMLLRKLAEKSGVKKGVNPHAFRHARATHLANRLTEAQMKQFTRESLDKRQTSIATSSF
jgi:integrase